MYRTLLTLIAAFVLAAPAAFAQEVPRQAAAEAQGEQGATQQAVSNSGPQRIEMTVLGLSCPFCAFGLEKKLKKIAGLTSLDIDVKSGKVTIEVEDGSKASDEQIKKLVKQAGFELEEVQDITRYSLAASPEAKQAGGA